MFTLPPAGTLGSVGRNSLIGPDFMTLDLALLKNVRLQGSTSLQLRAEIFNLTNRPNFGQPKPERLQSGPQMRRRHDQPDSG